MYPLRYAAELEANCAAMPAAVECPQRHFRKGANKHNCNEAGDSMLHTVIAAVSGYRV
jgi:hypothetical protein